MGYAQRARTSEVGLSSKDTPFQRFWREEESPSLVHDPAISTEESPLDILRGKRQDV